MPGVFGAGEMSAERTHMPRREGSEASLISRHPKPFMTTRAASRGLNYSLDIILILLVRAK